MNLDQQRKQLLTKLNYLWRNPDVSDDTRTAVLKALETLTEQLHTTGPSISKKK